MATFPESLATFALCWVFGLVLFAFFNVIGLFAAVTKGVKRLERNLTLSLVA